jgi:rod shape-determining protein MreC
VLTSGGDQIFPKGLPVGIVTKVSPGPELFLNIRVKPSADLSRLEEVLVITQQQERESLADGGQMRAADILAQRLPSVPDKPPDDPNKPPPPTSGLKILPAPTTPGTPSPKPNGAGAAAHSQSSPGSTTPAVTTPKPHVDSAGIMNNPGSVSSTAKPNGNSAAVKPATTKKPVSQGGKISDNPTNAAPGSQTQLAPSKLNQPSDPAAQPPSQEQPQ